MVKRGICEYPIPPLRGSFFFNRLFLKFRFIYNSFWIFLTEEIKKKVNYWFEMVFYDLETAKAMLKSKRYLYVGFFCHLIIEKALKGHFWFKIQEEPPFTHNLVILSDRSGLSNLLTIEQKILLSELMPLNIAGRYSHEKEEIEKILTKEHCNLLLNKTEELANWILKQSQ